MVVWRHHGAEPPETDVDFMLAQLKAVPTPASVMRDVLRR